MRKSTVTGAGASIGAALIAAPSAQAADFTVTTLNDSGGGSLRQAILDANAVPGADRVLFQSTLTGQITLGSELPRILEATQILGPGPDKLTISGNNNSRIFYVYPTAARTPVTISGLKLTGGNGNNTDDGGAIFSKYSNLLIENAVITGNTTPSGGNDGGSDREHRLRAAHGAELDDQREQPPMATAAESTRSTPTTGE